MNIVVLDGYTLNPGDLSWNELRSLGNCAVYDRSVGEEVAARAKDAEIILTNKVPLTSEIITQLPKVKYIGVLATGYNVVDVTAAKKRGIVVTNVPAYGTMSVAQLVFALLLELTHRIGHHADAVRNGRWTASNDFSFWDFPLVELAEKKFGIIGFGNIGQAAAKIASALGMNVQVSTRTPEKHKTFQVSETWKVSFVDTETLFTTSDVISLHCALTDETKHLVNSESLALMNPSAYLINTSRGGLVDEQALANALNNNQIAGAGLDVLSVEPPPSDNPLLTAKNCIITPHYAWATRSARERLMKTVVENVKAFINGKPKNVVS